MSQQQPEPMVTESDARAMIRVVADVGVMRGSLLDRKTKLMEGLCKLIDADVWMWGAFCDAQPGGTPVPLGFCYGGFTPEEMNIVLEAHNDTQTPLPDIQPWAELVQKHRCLTMRRQDLFPDDAAWYAHPGNVLWRQRIDLDHFVYSTRLIREPATYSSVGMHRRRGRPGFTVRETQIAEIVMTEVAWLHAMSLPDDPGDTVPQLTRRQRTVLNLLLHGQSKKQIAEQLQISAFTVGDYTKALYRHLGVGSRGELFTRFMGHNLRSPEMIHD